MTYENLFCAWCRQLRTVCRCAERREQLGTMAERELARIRREGGGYAPYPPVKASMPKVLDEEEA